MVSSEQVETMIREGLPDAQVQVQDLTGTMDHYKVVVVSAQFEGKRLVQRHQLVYSALHQALSSDAIHALTMETYTPKDWADLGQAV